MNGRFYLVRFVDGDHAYAEGRDGFDAARRATKRWGVPVERYLVPGLPRVWQLVKGAAA